MFLCFLRFVENHSFTVKYLKCKFCGIMYVLGISVGVLIKRGSKTALFSFSVDIYFLLLQTD